MNARAFTWAAALSGVGAALLWQFRDLITDAVLIGVVISIGLTIACWIFGAGVTEAVKRLFVEPPWSEREGMSNDERKHVRQVKRVFYGAAIVAGGIPLWLLLLAAFWPPTVFQAALQLVYGIGVGGLALPAVYLIVSKRVWPRLAALMQGGAPVVRTDDDGNVTGVRMPGEDKTRILGKPDDTVPRQ